MCLPSCVQHLSLLAMASVGLGAMLLSLAALAAALWRHRHSVQQ
jgi:hypothetical protein